MRIAPRVSVVMPVYNNAEYLEAALLSIRHQTFSDFEILIIDDGSTDASRDILDRHARDDERIKLFRLDHQGTSNVMNYGIERARGEYIAIMHSDDTAMPTRIQKQVSFLDVNPSVGVVGSSYDIIDKNGNCLMTVQNPSSSQLCRTILVEEGRNCVCNHSTMVRKSAFEKAGPYHQLLWPAEDYDIWLRISDFSDVTNIPEALVTYRFHFENVSLRRTYQQSLAMAAAHEATLRRRAGDSYFLDNVVPLTWDKLNAQGVSNRAIFASMTFLYSSYLGVALRCRKTDVIARLFNEFAEAAKSRFEKHAYIRVISFLLVRLLNDRKYLQASKYLCYTLTKGPWGHFTTVIRRVLVQLRAERSLLYARTCLEKQNENSEVRTDIVELIADLESKTAVLTILGWSPRLIPYRDQMITVGGLPPPIKLAVSRMPYHQTTEKTGLFFRGFLLTCVLPSIPEEFDKSRLSIFIE
jgi:glycosyltransferase involved in cell wall biosynthesis